MSAQIESIPTMVPISDLRIRQSSVLASVTEGPVVLTQHGRAAVVLVQPELWNDLVRRLEDLQDALDVMRGREEMREDSAGARPWEEVRTELEARGPVRG